MWTAITLVVLALAGLVTIIWKSESAAKWREQKKQLARGEAAQEREDAAASKLRHRRLKRSQLRDLERMRRVADAAGVHDASGRSGGA